MRSYGEFEFWFASIKVAAIIAFIVLTLSFALGLTGGGDGGFSHLTSDGVAPEGLGKVLTGVAVVLGAAWLRTLQPSSRTSRRATSRASTT